MFQRFQAMKEEREGGFTLIELLVVILIIAILAAIAIPVFLRQREKGWVSQTQSALKNAATAQESFLTTNGVYSVVADGQELIDDEGLKVAADVTLVVTANGGTDYCIEATHASLPAGHDWETGTYDSNVGEPAAGANC